MRDCVNRDRVRASVNARPVRDTERCVARETQARIAYRRIVRLIRPAKASSNSSAASSNSSGSDNSDRIADGSGGWIATWICGAGVTPGKKRPSPSRHAHDLLVASAIMRCGLRIITCHENPVVLA